MLMHQGHRATTNCTPEEVKGCRNIKESIEEECGWIADDELAEHAQQDVSSSSLLIAVLDSEEENDIHPSDLLHFSMILSKGISSWYQSTTNA